MAKTDIADAFRIVPINKRDQHLLGFRFNHQWYFDRCLPMGCSSACKIFERVSDAIVHILKVKYNVINIVKYLDDFIFITKSKEDCHRAMAVFSHLCNIIGVPIAKHKTEGPSTKMIFLGYHIDTSTMVVSIPANKITQYKENINSFLIQKQCTLRQLKSMIGKLQFVTNVVNIGRCFLRRLINLTCGLKHPATIIRLNAGALEDLKLWKKFLACYNGKTLIKDQIVVSSPSLHFYSDSSKIAYAGVFGREYISGRFPLAWKKLSIQVLELYPIFAMLHLFAHRLSGCSLIFHCDNKSVVYNINAQTSKNRKIMVLLRPMILLMLKYKFNMKAVHVAGKENKLADKISRLQASPDFLRAQGMNPSPTPLPKWLKPLSVKI